MLRETTGQGEAPVNVKQAIEHFLITEVLSKDGISHVEPNMSLIKSGIIDSLTLLQLISFIEETFGVTLEDHELLPENFETLSTMGQLVEGKLQARPA
jgi:acyl carrier protein